MVLTLAFGVGLAACSPDPDDVPAGEDDAMVSVTTEWVVEAAVELGEKLGGVTLADLDPESPGNEIAVLGVSGRVWSVAWSDGAWTATELAQLPGEGIVVVAGDLDGRQGDELVVGGMAEGGEEDGGEGSLRLLSRSGDGWNVTELHRSSALVHGACLTDVDGDGQLEVAAAGFAEELVVARRGDDGSWNTEVVAPLTAAAKSLVGWAGGVTVAQVDGNVTSLLPGDDGWTTLIADEILAGRARLATDEEGLLVASDDGSLVLLGAGPRREIHRSSDKLRGAVLANLLPASKGQEAATAGYDGRIVVLSDLQGKVTERVVHTDGDKLHHLASGTLEARAHGVHLVAVGYSGRVLVALGPGW
jgi:hypothetical protein